jgi:hypothetical protein
VIGFSSTKAVSKHEFGGRETRIMALGLLLALSSGRVKEPAIEEPSKSEEEEGLVMALVTLPIGWGISSNVCRILAVRSLLTVR